MTIEDATDLAAFFDTEDFAVEAVWRAGGTGSPTTVSVLPALSDRDVDVFGQSVRSSAGVFLVRASDIEAPAAGDTLTIDGTIWTIQGVPARGIDRAIWRIEAVEE